MGLWTSLIVHIALDILLLLAVGAFPALVMWNRDIEKSALKAYLAAAGLAFIVVVAAHLRLFNTLLRLQELGWAHRLTLCVIFAALSIPTAYAASRGKVKVGWILAVGLIALAIPVVQLVGLRFFKPSLTNDLVLERSLRNIQAEIELKDPVELAKNIGELQVPAETGYFDVAIMPILRGALMDKNPGVATAAAMKIGERNDYRLLPDLLDAIAEAPPGPRETMESVAETLASTPEAALLLKDATLQKNGAARKFAMSLLAKKYPSTLQAMLPELLKSPDPELQQMASEMIRSGQGKMDVAKLIANLMAAVNSGDAQTAGPALATLATLTDYPEAREKLKPEPFVAILKSGSPSLKAAAAKILKTIVTPAQIPALIEIANSSDPNAALYAIDALVNMKAKEATEVYANALFNPKAEIRILGYQGLKCVLPRSISTDDPVVQKIKTASAAENNLPVRRAAAELLAWLDVPNAFEYATGLLASAGSSSDKLSAINAFDYLSDERALPPLFKLAKDSDAQVRKAAIAVIGHIGDSRVVADLRKLKNDPDPAVKAAVVSAIEETSKKTPPAPTPAPVTSTPQ